MKIGCNFELYSTGEIVSLNVNWYILIPYLEEEAGGKKYKNSDDVDSDVADSYTLDIVQDICIFFVCSLKRQILIYIF